MKKIIYTCDICGNVLSEEPTTTFTFPVQIGYHSDDLLITTLNPPKIVVKSYMLCETCKHQIANDLLNRGIVSE